MRAWFMFVATLNFIAVLLLISPGAGDIKYLALVTAALIFPYAVTRPSNPLLMVGAIFNLMGVIAVLFGTPATATLVMTGSLFLVSGQVMEVCKKPKDD